MEEPKEPKEERKESKERKETPENRENVYLLTYSFNQDFSNFVAGTTAGFRVFGVAGQRAPAEKGAGYAAAPAPTSPVEELRRREHSPGLQHSAVMHISMLNKTSIFAMATLSLERQGEGLASMNKVQIWDEKKQKTVAELRCRNEVKGVYLHKDVIVMVCEYVIYVYTSGDRLKVILHLDTGSNKLGLCALAYGSDPCIICCPAQNRGAVRIQVGQDAQATHVFQAHQSGLAALALTTSGSLVATASETGTVMKVFRTADGEALYRLRRSTRAAHISCLTFRDDAFLAVASSSVTVHIFKLDNATAAEVEDPEKENSAHASPALKPAPEPWPRLTALQTLQHKGAEVLRGLTPQYLADLRSFGQFRVPDMDGGPALDTRSRLSHIAGPILAFHKTEPRLYVLHYNGFLYECGFQPDGDPTTTQECTFLSATAWFANRPEFTLATGERKTEPGETDGEEWQLL
ncbi:unnamed protein product [Effrenium voratum]|uniref:WD repeat domain phosphoinositide-interacting protein 2 n=1 Tax=Effrenium voratum TaxID=2562239 RepID=A0AA36JTF5_9DINO|nr:unnamed protein product [Effrenium voratum]